MTYMPSLICHVYKLGLVDYSLAWQLQERLAGEIGRGERLPVLLLLEHPHTFTFGRQSKAEHLLWGAAELERRGVQVYWTDRGGDVTYHGPGQLVGYPLLPLAIEMAGAIPKIDSLGYIRRLESALLQALQMLGVPAQTVKGLTGIWVAGATREHPRKVAAIGVKVDSRGITRHGFALNVNPEMAYWEGIVGCGLAGYQAISLEQLLTPPPGMAQVKAAVVQALGEVFGYSMLPVAQEEVL